MCLLTACVFTTASAQKIGYASVELILAYMPETKAMNQKLETYQKKLQEQLQVKQGTFEQKYRDYLQIQEKLSESERKTRESELLKMDEELRSLAVDLEKKLMSRRQELVEPIITKLQNTIDEVAKAEGYTWVFNTVDGTGVSIVLHAPESDDLTKKILKKMGVTVN